MTHIDDLVEQFKTVATTIRTPDEVKVNSKAYINSILNDDGTVNNLSYGETSLAMAAACGITYANKPQENANVFVRGVFGPRQRDFQEYQALIKEGGHNHRMRALTMFIEAYENSIFGEMKGAFQNDVEALNEADRTTFIETMNRDRQLTAAGISLPDEPLKAIGALSRKIDDYVAYLRQP